MRCQANAMTITMMLIDFFFIRIKKKKKFQVKLLSENCRAYDNAYHNLVYYINMHALRENCLEDFYQVLI